MPMTAAASERLFIAIREIVNRYDLSGIRHALENDFPEDEYHAETASIESALVNRGPITVADLRAIWLHWFNDDLRGKEADASAMVEKLNALLAQKPS
jgi:hypothetical protein